MNYVLGIESTAHTFGVAIVDSEGKILSNVKDVYTTEKGGMIPLEVKKHHQFVSEELYKKAIEESKIPVDKIVAVAFSNAPGLSPCLLEGMRFAKKIAEELNVPLVPVNHCIAHLEIGETTGAKDPVLLYASGANTQIIAYETGKYRVFGETLDLGVGNFIDTFARYAGMGFPGGPKIQKLAEAGKNFIELPYSIKGMDVSFSGLQTKLKNLLDKNGQLGKSNQPDKFFLERLARGRKSNSDPKSPPVENPKFSTELLEDLAFSMQETVFAMLVEAAERALAHTGKKELLLGGGVACNSRLQEMCRLMCEERNVKYFCPERSLLVDNAGMIAYLGLKMYKARIFEKDLDKIDINPRERTDDVQVKWK